MNVAINKLVGNAEKWRFTRLILVTAIVLSCSQANAAARVTAGITGLFDKQTATITQPALNDINLNDDLGVTNNVSLYELYAGIHFNDFSMRGYYLQNRSQDGIGTLKEGQFKKTDKDDKRKFIPVNSTFGFRACRFEVGMPFIYTDMILEPFVVASTTNSSLNMQGEKLNVDLSNIKSGPGLGVQIVQKAASNANVTFKAYKTNIDSLVELEYASYSRNMFWKAGYSWRRFNSDNISLNLSGPKVEIGVVF